MDRRHFLRAGLVSAGGAVALPTVATVASAQPAGTSPYGSIEGLEPDANGVILPEGFTSRIVGRAGEPVEGTDYEWHVFPDGAATFDDGEGGWYHTVNSEVFLPGGGGVGAIHYDADGEIIDAYPILEGSLANCAGGPTPWGTWLSCEEDFGEQGLVWECDPTGQTEAVSYPAMGRFAHEAVAVDPEAEQLYMTQDHPTGLLYRYTPDAYPDLTTGLLEAATVADDGSVTWAEVPDPSGADTPTREQVPGATFFAGGEGIWYHDGEIFFTTKFDNVVHAIDVRAQTYRRIYEAIADDVAAGTSVLSGVDNITVDAGSGDLFVAEDGGNMELVVITPEGEVAPFCRVVDQDDSEITGPCFNPTRDRLYFSSQRGPSGRTVGEIRDDIDGDVGAGLTFEISGPFRGAIEPEPEPTTSTEGEPEATETTAAPEESAQAPTTTLAAAGEPTESDDGDDDGGGSGALIAGGAVAAAAVVGGGILALRRRGDADQQAPDQPDVDA